MGVQRVMYILGTNNKFGRHLPVMDTVIPATVRLAEVSTADKSIFQYEPRGRAADAYRKLTKEVLEIGEKQRSRTSDLPAPIPALPTRTRSISPSPSPTTATP